MEQVSPFWSLLESTSTNTIVPTKRPLIAFLTQQPIEQVLSGLSAHHILSGPVVNSSDHTIVGSVDVQQIADYVAEKSGTDDEKQPISKVIDHCHKSVHSRDSIHEAMTPFYASNPLSLLVDLFSTGIHRVALFPDSCELISTCSQSDVIVFLSQNLNKNDAVKSYVNQSIQKLFGSRHIKLLSVSEETSVRATISTMMSSGVSSVAITDAEGHLVGAFAASDLRGLVDLTSLKQPIATYCKAHGTTPVIVKSDETLAHVIITMATKRQHRVWVVDASFLPVSVISTTDIMRAIGSGTPVTARQANADIDAHKLWIAPPQTIKMSMEMSDPDNPSTFTTIHVEASTQTKIGGINH